MGTLNLTIPNPGRHPVTSIGGPVRLATGRFTFSNSYPTGGETLALPPGLPVVTIDVPPSGGYVFEYAAGKIKAYWSAGSGAPLSEVTGGTDLSAVVCDVIIHAR